MRTTLVRNYHTIILCMLSYLILFPLFITFSNSFMSENEIGLHYATTLSDFDISAGIEDNFVEMNLIPNEATVEQYRETLINQPSFLMLLMNSLKITVPVVIGNVIVSLLTAYGFTIWKWKYKEAVFYIYIFVMLMPLQAVLVPNYMIADMINTKDSYLAIILPGIFSPFGTFLLRQSMKAIPVEYFEAAAIDGAGLYYTFIHIVIPQMKSGIAALSMLVFIEYWNVVEQVIIFIKDYYREPLSVYLSRIAEGRIGIIFAASVIYMVLPLWFLLVGQKNLEKGIELSGIK
ncbi:carbohydrate ABC transporter permease [Schinkia azotoformans]|uniref:carbohydrate ABC transporter permease n=1 Tax=Schinkia azotoformans TaxID=1454 RepID=UPI002DBB338F|nr:carbohydrate ABC transporter permease [Schinkia azotoformans]MEC1722557.1 carbohydrate ABC transporter permease [Schinkia azotoformans]MED4411552.1 carbohydrate ABC transporter permease [Schinkia azotoformans]